MGNFVSGHVSIADGAFEAKIRIPLCTSARATSHRREVSCQASSSSLATTRKSRHFLSSVVDTIKSAVHQWVDGALATVCVSSSVLSDIDEAWLDDVMAEFDTALDANSRRKQPVKEIEEQPAVSTTFMGPHDTTINTSTSTSLEEWMNVRLVKNEFDCASCTTDSTDLISEAECDSAGQDLDFYSEDDDTETKADRLLRLASSCSADDCCVYVEDYLCSCGECPAYKRIEHAVKHAMTCCSSQEQTSIIRVLQAFSTYNETIGFQPEMIAAAEECLQIWLGDEDQALKSMVIMFDEIPQLCTSLA